MLFIDVSLFDRYSHAMLNNYIVMWTSQFKSSFIDNSVYCFSNFKYSVFTNNNKPKLVLWLCSDILTM